MSGLDDFSTPVLLCVFNRPELTLQVIEAMREVAPTKIYVSADGPRVDVTSDAVNCGKVREAIATIDWDCELHIRFLDENLGCGKAISSAIDWLFENEDEGIILEDDTVPTPAFFPFCSVMLDTYRTDSRIFMVSGTNFFPSTTSECMHFFTRVPAAWGWATWRRAWELYDFEVHDWKDLQTREGLLSKVDNRVMRNYARICLDDVVQSRVNTWDYQWQMLGLFGGKYGVTSGANLVTNIGIEGTHSNKVSKSHLLPISIDFQVVNSGGLSAIVKPEKKYDRRFILRRIMPIVIKRKLRQMYVRVTSRIKS